MSLQENQQVKEERITVKVVSQDGGEIFFKIKQDARLERLMEAYCKRQGINIASTRFVFDGNRINKTQTPRDLEMVENDCIDVLVEQTGGLANTLYINQIRIYL